MEQVSSTHSAVALEQTTLKTPPSSRQGHADAMTSSNANSLRSWKECSAKDSVDDNKTHPTTEVLKSKSTSAVWRPRHASSGHDSSKKTSNVRCTKYRSTNFGYSTEKARDIRPKNDTNDENATNFKYEKYMISPQDGSAYSFTDFRSLMTSNVNKPAANTSSEGAQAGSASRNVDILSQRRAQMSNLMSTSLPNAVAFDVTKYIYRGKNTETLDNSDELPKHSGRTARKSGQREAKCSTTYGFQSKTSNFGGKSKEFGATKRKQFCPAEIRGQKPWTYEQSRSLKTAENFQRNDSKTQENLDREIPLEETATFSEQGGNLSFYTPNPLQQNEVEECPENTQTDDVSARESPLEDCESPDYVTLKQEVGESLDDVIPVDGQVMNAPPPR